jgi:hypothetical protein
MTLPVKGSRPIDIAGIPCRWVVTGKPTDPELCIIIQSENGGALTIRVQQEIEGMVWLKNKKSKSHCGPITPNWVRELADQALERGWDPTNPKSFEL